MRRFAILITSAVTVVSCAPEDHGADSIHNKCVADLYASYNPRALDVMHIEGCAVSYLFGRFCRGVGYF